MSSAARGLTGPGRAGPCRRMRTSLRSHGIVDAAGDGWGSLHRVRAMRGAGRPVTDLTIGEHDRRTDPAILAAMDASARGGNTGYVSVWGMPALREAVAARVARTTGAPTTPDEVLITPGGQAALFSALMTTCDPGDRAVMISPAYATYPGTIRAASAVPRVVEARPEDGFVPRAEALAAVAQDARALVLNTPNNPTGAVYSAATLLALAEAAPDAWLICDEVYDTQVWEGAHVSPRALPGLAERTLVVGSMSKGHAMTGSRIGWLAGPAEAIVLAHDLATHTTYGVPGFIQDAALHALSMGEALERRVAEPFGLRRAVALGALAPHAGVSAHEPGGAMYLMADVRATGLTGEAFAAALLERHAVAVMPGESFGRPAAGHVRVALTADDAALAEAMTRLGEMASALAARRAA